MLGFLSTRTLLSHIWPALQHLVTQVCSCPLLCLLTLAFVVAAAEYALHVMLLKTQPDEAEQWLLRAGMHGDERAQEELRAREVEDFGLI